MKTLKICTEALPVAIMIGLIPLIQDDYLLTLAYVLVIAACFFLKREEHDVALLLFGFITLTISEGFFISTGVEIFERKSLFGIMPLWLPFLWAYAFVAIKRSIRILESK